MNPQKNTTPPVRPSAKPKKSLNPDLKTIVPVVKQQLKRVSKHAPFIAIMLVLLVYVYVVWNIRNLATAEPTIEQETAALTNTEVPKIDQKAIDQIQTLEKNSPAVRTLIEKARTNPFNE